MDTCHKNNYKSLKHLHSYFKYSCKYPKITSKNINFNLDDLLDIKNDETIDINNLLLDNIEVKKCLIYEKHKKKNGILYNIDNVIIHFGVIFNNYKYLQAISDNERKIYKNLHKKIKLLKDAGIKEVTMATNVQLLDKKRIYQYLDAGLDDIMVSIDGITKDTFEKIRVNLDYETVVQNSLNLIKIRDQKRLPLIIRLRMIIMDSNQHEVQDWISFWKDKVGPNDQVYAKTAHTWGNQLNRETDESIKAYAHKPCIAPFSSMIIHTNGTVPMCSIDYSSKVKIGDFSKDSIEKIWNDGPMMNIRKLHANSRRNEIALCQGCRIWEEDRKTWF